MSVARVWLTMATLLLATTPSFADDILGTWLRDDGTVRVKFEPCDNTICGNIVWLKSDTRGPAKPSVPAALQSTQVKCRSPDQR